MTGTASYAATGLSTLERVLSGFDCTGTRWALLRGRVRCCRPWPQYTQLTIHM